MMAICTGPRQFDHYPRWQALKPEQDASDIHAPSAEAPYNLPAEFKNSESMMERGMWSMWGHFVGFLEGSDIPEFSDNPFLETSRLPVFQSLGNGATDENHDESAVCNELRLLFDCSGPEERDVEPPTTFNTRWMQSPTTVTQGLDLSDDEDGEDSNCLWERFPAKPIMPTKGTKKTFQPSPTLARPVPRFAAVARFDAVPANDDMIPESDVARMMGSLYSEVLLL